MNKKKWLALFDATCDKFKWFWLEYYEETVWMQLMAYRLDEDIVMMISIMSDVWFDLPDGRFNIIVNPNGWNEFLYLLEEPPTDL